MKGKKTSCYQNIRRAVTTENFLYKLKHKKREKILNYYLMDTMN